MKQIVAIIVALWAFGLSHDANAQDSSTTPLSLSAGGVDTEGGNGAIQAQAEYDLALLDIFRTGFDPTADEGWLLDFSPSVLLRVGEDDAFSNIIAKIEGNLIFFDTVQVAGVTTPDTEALFHAIPVSAGFETDQNFDDVNGLFEVGYIPFALGALDVTLGGEVLRIGLNPRVGAFLQAGYKFDTDDDDDNDNDERAIDSEEEPDSALLRVKLAGSAELPLLRFGENGGNQISVVLDLAGWYDAANGELYDQEIAILRFGLREDTFFDLRAENGSGAPNFSEGEQFGAFLTVAF